MAAALLRKALFYGPFAVFAAFYAFIVLELGPRSIRPVALLYLLLLWLEGALLDRDKPWGCLAGCAAAVPILLAASQNWKLGSLELAVGVALALYCLLCGAWVLRRGKRAAAADDESGFSEPNSQN